MKKLCLALTLLSAFSVSAQSSKPDAVPEPEKPKVLSAQRAALDSAPLQEFVLKFVAREVNGKTVINTREYRIQVAIGDTRFDSYQIRTGDKLPVAAGGQSKAVAEGGQLRTNFSQFTYVDLGVNLDLIGVHMNGNQIATQLVASINSMTESESDKDAPPIVRSNSWRVNILLKPNEPQLVLSSDDLASKKTLQLEVTAIPLH